MHKMCSASLLKEFINVNQKNCSYNSTRVVLNTFYELKAFLESYLLFTWINQARISIQTVVELASTFGYLESKEPNTEKKKPSRNK